MLMCFAVFAWGRGDLGQLGVGDEADRDSPTLVESFSKKDIVHIAASDFHTAFLTSEGEVYTTGSNESGQLGTHLPENQLLPEPVAALDTQIVVHVACGQGHTVAVTDTGALASWGAAEFGQLGQKEAVGVLSVSHPRILKGSRELHFVRAACGASHTLALTGSGDVYSFGQGTFGALGHGNTESCSVPTFVNDLWGFGIVQIACGENHSVALSIDGQVFSWGRGKYGQLGHGSLNNEMSPLQVKALADQMIVQIVSGGDHTMAVNSEKLVLAWGRGHWGQTGLGTLADVHTPTEVHLPQGELVVQAAAGARHTVVLTESGNLFGWGDGEQGQLGRSASNKVQTFPFQISDSMGNGLAASYVVAGGNHTLLVYRPSVGRLDGLKSNCTTQSNGMVLKEEASSEMVVATGGVMHGDGLRPVTVPELASMLEVCVDHTKRLHSIGHAVEDIFSSTRFIVVAFKHQPSFWRNRIEVSHTDQKDYEDVGDLGLNVESIRNAYQRILELRNLEILKRLGDSIIRLLMSIEKHMNIVPQSRWIRALLVGLQCPLVGEKGLGDMVSTRIFSVFSRLSLSDGRKIKIWLSTYPREIFGGRFVRGVLRYLSNRKDFASRRGIHQDVAGALKTLWFLHEANKLEHLLPYSEFYSKEISETADFFEEYLKWQQGKDDKESQAFLSFCQVPFILTPRAKSKILQVEADIWKSKIVKEAIFQKLSGDIFACPFLVLRVRRTHLIHDTLGQLNVDRINYKKPLKVVFEGEEGVDEGGITKEFFQLLCRELFNVDYGMFTYNEETRNFWFNSNSMESESTFELVGIILGLGIYNNVILDVHLPLVVFKRLLGLRPQLSDVNDLQPQLAKSLQQLLDYDGDVEDTFSLTFQVTYDYFGEMKTYDLQPGGGDLPVTNENKEKYVELYVQYVLEDSIENQFVPFNEGFQQVCGGHALQLFHYEELELLICGLPHFDFEALEKVTIYYGGYTKESEIVKWFWELVKEMPLEEKKSLLFFTTGNDRAPVGGLGSLQFIIQRNDGETDRLPTAHTCFNIKACHFKCDRFWASMKVLLSRT
ncbi:hypothetical protein GOP47_0011212 [Adiantum capillus-veneris]|uniref:HECT domain-containing protein n=1 Tax=Adiantum capillus-veneris TaxID=13818 RepID=A0A9D4USS3_ADICA|nr:hypothetical protein GOP47_0011212 [Adiantum capillus-veneris]